MLAPAFGLRHLTGAFAPPPDAAGSIACWAHIDGFVFGALLCSVIKVKHFYRRSYEGENMPW